MPIDQVIVPDPTPTPSCCRVCGPSGICHAQALDMLAGMEATPAAGGAFTFRHRASGLAFAIGPAPPPAEADSDAEGSAAEPELAFQPLALGSAAEVHPAQVVTETGHLAVVSRFLLCSWKRHGGLQACLPQTSMPWRPVPCA